MKRRDFLNNFFQNDNISYQLKRDDKPRLLAPLTKKNTPLTRKEAYHLLRRMTFNVRPELVDQFTGKTVDEAAALILGTGNEPLPQIPSDDWATKPYENPLAQIQEIRSEIEGSLKSNYSSFVKWWVELMRAESLPSVEKLTLFLTTVWCIEFTYDTLALIPSPLLLKNNQTLRMDRLGNYDKIAEDMTIDGAMLLYQSLYYSTGENPNENYMRELMELFTMGIGNYTQGDIVQGSRVLTGWRTSPYFLDPGKKGYFNTYFEPKDHDIGAKTFMGETIPARDSASNTEDQVLNEEVRGLLNIMFTNRAEAVSMFVCEKIYRYFVYSNPGSNDSSAIESLAEVFRNSNFNLRSVYESLLTSEHFFDPLNFGVQIKTPPEFIVSFENQLNVTYSKATDSIFNLEQELYDPPNVGSWKAYRTWISTKTYPLRIKYANEILGASSDQNLIDLAKKFTNFDDPDKLTLALEEFFLPVDVSSERHAYYLNKLLTGAGTVESGWSSLINSNNTDAADGVRNLIGAIIKSPDFQLL